MACSKGFGLDFEILRQLNRDQLIRILEEESGYKDLVIDGELMKMLDRIADAKVLRNHGVQKIYRLESVPPPVDCLQRIYITQPYIANIKYIADHTNSDITQYPQLKTLLVIIPRILHTILKLLEEEGLYGIIKLQEFSPNFIPLDNDLISLEYINFFRDTFLDYDTSYCVSVAKALHTLQELYGEASTVVGYGRICQSVVHSLKLLKDTSEQLKQSQASEIENIFIFDRDMDYVTALLTQLTYEGSLDEHFSIQAGVVEFPPEVIESNASNKVPLNSKDTVFDNIRNRHFAGVTNYLIVRAKEVQKRKQQSQNMSTTEMKEFVTNELRTLQSVQKSLALHLGACESITSRIRSDFDVQLTTEHGLVTGVCSLSDVRTFIEDCIASQVQLSSILRLLCLYSITQEGFSQKEYESLSSQLLSAHGFEHLVTLHNLHKMGLLQLSETSVNTKDTSMTSTKQVIKQVTTLIKKDKIWRKLVKQLQLIPDSSIVVDLHNPEHMSYVFNGAYTPALPKIVLDTLSQKLGPHNPDALKFIPKSYLLGISDHPLTSSSKATIVLFLGGVTFAEVAALRLLSVMTSNRFIIATTSTVTGTSLIMAALPS